MYARIDEPQRHIYEISLENPRYMKLNELAGLRFDVYKYYVMDELFHAPYLMQNVY